MQRKMQGKKEYSTTIPADADLPRRVEGGGGEWEDVAARTLELGLTVRTGRCCSAAGVPLPASCSSRGGESSLG